MIADEAHRSQYDTFAQNLRNALPNAAFIGFTGTPLMAGEEKTREVFGDYVSIYNFRQAIEDNATVPLYYEARIPELQLANEDLADDLTELLDQADLDEEQQKKVEREFARQYQLLTREPRLDRIAEDIVTHFLGLPRGMKAMVVAIDKVTAVRMHDKVKAAWAKRRAALQAQLEAMPFDEAKKAQQEAIDTTAFMDETDMAVVVSQSQNEVEAFKKKGLDIAPHRQRMSKEDLDTKFKDDKCPLRIVFVCAMWITGFDVPSCGAIYLDKPMKNHSLMQTIARANRVYEGKENGSSSTMSASSGAPESAGDLRLRLGRQRAGGGHPGPAEGGAARGAARHDRGGEEVLHRARRRGRRDEEQEGLRSPPAPP